jgi:hypothetical protein
MMKRILGMVLALMLLASNALAVVELTDAPGTPTQDKVISMSAAWEDEANTAYDLTPISANQLTMDVVQDMYDFVYVQGNRPVRWFPEETQKAIEEMINGNPDPLNSTEFMLLNAPETEVAYDLHVTLDLTIAYVPGQLTVVVLGIGDTMDELVWTPVKSEVTGIGRIEFHIPKDVMATLQGKQIQLDVLTSSGNGDGDITVTTTEIPVEVPSKQASDTSRIIKTVITNGDADATTFELFVVADTVPIKNEIALLKAFLDEKTHNVMSWLPTDAQNRIQMLLGIDCSQLIVSDYVSLMTKNFHPTDGDAVGTLAFATAYRPVQAVITVLGTPKNDADSGDGTTMEWAVQPATVNPDGSLDIVFDQMALIEMGTTAGVLLVLSVPVVTE